MGVEVHASFARRVPQIPDAPVSYPLTMENPPRAQSVMQLRPSGFQSRATRFLQKVTNFARSQKVKPTKYNGPYPRSGKPYMSQPALGLQSVNPDNVDSSDDDTTPRRSMRLSVEIPEPGRARLQKSSKRTPPLPSGIILGAHAAVTVGTRSPMVEGLPVVSSPPAPPPKPPREITDDIMIIDRQHLTPVTTPNLSLPLGAAAPHPPGSIADRSQTPPRITASASLPASSSTPPRLPSLRISGLPSSLNQLGMDGSARTPSLVTRHPLPILNLPTLPPPSPRVTSQRLRLRASLRAMPALPLKGSDDPDPESDHENSGLGDTDDEDEEAEAEAEETAMQTGSDDDDEDLSESASRGNPYAKPILPGVDTSRIDLSFLNHPHGTPPRTRAREGDATPTVINRSSRDYFSANPNRDGTLSRSPARTPHPDDKNTLRLTASQSNVARVMPMPATSSGSRPVLYQHASKSMVDILSISKRESIVAATAVEVERRKSVVKGKGKTLEPQPGNEEPSTTMCAAPAYDSLSNALLRRRSMPTFNSATLPPPYPSFAPHPMRRDIVIQPRDDEGKERLPPYTNSIYLSAIMPRKLEFSAPGIQAKDRKWHRVLCVLEGTSFRVYKCSRILGVGILGQWWEKKVGAGDAAVSGPSSAMRPKRPAERPAKIELDVEGLSVERTADVPQSPPTPTARIPKRLGSRLRPAPPAHSRSRSDMPTYTSSRPSLNIPTQSGSSYSSSTNLSINVPSSTSSNFSSTVSSARSHFRSNSSQVSVEGWSVDPPVSDIIRSYTLQNAESGLGNDYLKRQHVIRVRLEGEQFLLQATDMGAVVDWIEGIQAATNIALDLDERPMPKGPIFPRRRRRRPPTATRPPGSRSTANAPN